MSGKMVVDEDKEWTKNRELMQGNRRAATMGPGVRNGRVDMEEKQHQAEERKRRI